MMFSLLFLHLFSCAASAGSLLTRVMADLRRWASLVFLARATRLFGRSEGISSGSIKNEIKWHGWMVVHVILMDKADGSNGCVGI